jgi:hypothetical protein
MTTKTRTIDFSRFSSAHVAAFRALDPDSLTDVEVLDPDTIRGTVDAVEAVIDIVLSESGDAADVARWLPIYRHHMANQSLPAAACPRCGGWTAYGGMAQHAASTHPVHGRAGCVCHLSKGEVA